MSDSMINQDAFTSTPLPYHTVLEKSRVPIDVILKNHIDQAAINACKACKNYGNVWSCPPFEFQREDYWRRYATLELWCLRIIFSVTNPLPNMTSEEIDARKFASLVEAKRTMEDQLLEAEGAHPGAMSLFPGACWHCSQGCRRREGKPCVNPRRLRHSIESLGGNNLTLIRENFGWEFEWAEPGRVPHYYLLTGGTLLP